MNKVGTLELSLRRVEQLMTDEPDLLTGSRLKGEVGDWIEREWKRQAKPRPTRLLVYLPPLEKPKATSVATETAAYFQAKRRQQEVQRSETLRQGLSSAQIGLVFLVLVLIVAELISYLEGRVPAILSEGLSIFAWIALWRPTEELLYDWYPHVRELRYYRQMEMLNVEIRDSAV